MSMRYLGGYISPSYNPLASNITTSPNTAQWNGIFTIQQQGNAAQKNQWVTDPSQKAVTLLLRADNATNGSQNNTFLDTSGNNHTITRNGNPTQGTFVPYEPNGYWSAFFDGSSYITVGGTSSNLGWATGNFTMEAWVYSTANNSQNIIFDARTSDSGTAPVWYTNSSGTLIWRRSNTNLIAAGTLPLNQWTLIAVSRSGTTTRQFINGVLVGSGTDTVSYAFATNPKLGKAWDTNYWNGYISNYRLIRGGTAGIYTANYTPPTLPFTNADASAALLLCQSNRFIDNGNANSNPYPLTPTGNMSVQPFSPFTPVYQYTPQGMAGSGFFDGTGDYLTLPSSANVGLTGNITLEAWFITSSLANTTWIVSSGASTSGSYGLRIDTTGQINAFIDSFSTARITSGAGLPCRINAWTHVALVRSSGTYTLYLQGVAMGTYASTATFGGQSGASIFVGTYSLGTAQALPGYITGLRLVNSAVYTADFTPPSAPPTAITNTRYLLNFTNAGIFDGSMSSTNVETVGNAQISTSVYKYGSGSLSFDGTGDWLLVPHSPNHQLTTGAFTIEFWLYLNAIGAARGLVSKGTSTTGWQVGLTSANAVQFIGGDTITSSQTLVANTWYHIAVVREGTGTNQTKIYINGANDGVATVTTYFNQTDPMYVGANRVAGEALNGYIDDLRITKGVARYTANFIPPQVALSTQ